MKWGLVAKADIEHVRKEALWLRDCLTEHGEEVLLEDSLAGAEGVPGHSLAQLDDEADLFMTVGGDGTILMTQVTQKPVFAVNAGAIGFLAEVDPPMAKQAIERVIAGDYRVEERFKLSAHMEGERLMDATNEVTLQTSRIAKLIHFQIRVDGETLDSLRGDGMIVSTPTGSTGYAMSVGGPLVHPKVEGVVLAPIAPFRLSARPWVIPGDATVELTVLPRDSARDESQAKVVVDGQHAWSVPTDATVRIERSGRKSRFIRLSSGFYERVRNKLTR